MAEDIQVQRAERLLVLAKKKKEHMDAFREFVEDLIKNKDGRIFYTGNCAECSKIDHEMSQIALNIITE